MSLIDPHDSLSYEQWMNEQATAASTMPRGWQAAFQPRCDQCGKFVNEKGDGVSWSHSFSYDMDGVPYLEDIDFRCSPCTDKHGVKPTNCNESESKYHGRNEVSP